MKKIVSILVMILLLTGCSTKKEEKKEIKKEEVKIEEKKEEYVDNNPIVIGIYENNTNLIKEFTTTKENFKDIVFSVYYTQDEYLENDSQKNNFYKYYNSYQNIDNYKIGYHLSFYSGNNHIEKTILEPDTFAFNPYFYIYLYDDIHQQDGVSYSHLEKEDVNADTIFSAIKIYLVEADKITSPIELTVFTYDEDDFDESNHYRGNSKFTTTIKWN